MVALVLMLWSAVPLRLAAAGSPAAGALLERIAGGTVFGIAFDGTEVRNGLRLIVRQGEGTLGFTLENTGSSDLALDSVVLAEFDHGFLPETPFYGEGFSMFCSTGGTLAKPLPGDPYTDEAHYRLPGLKGFATTYNYTLLRPQDGRPVLIGFTSCRRFNGRLHWNAERLRISLATEGLVLKAGARWTLEDLMVVSGPDADKLMETFGRAIAKSHPRLPWPERPTGWCSWYGYGPRISAKIVADNLAAMKTHLPGLRYVQIDDGYQPWMGDWLESGRLFPEGIPALCRTISEAGFVPAIWVAPFIASPESELFRKHPDWFVRDAAGRPLSTKGVTFPGWRQGPWYMLDGTHPGARAYLTQVFRTMRGWGIRYFKLDANAWGALPFGRRYDPAASSVEAYRMGMRAVIEGAGPDAFILGCNHAYWPSLGIIHGSRTSYDIGHSFPGFVRVARQNLLRNWMNGRLWWNDPDCLLLPQPVDPARLPPLEGPDGVKRVNEAITQDRLSFHLAATLATGGMLLSGDRLVDYDRTRWAFLAKALGAPGRAARFADDRLEEGVLDNGDEKWFFLLNWESALRARFVAVPEGGTLSDYWTGQSLERSGGRTEILLPPTSGRVLVWRKTP
ncbi:MAG: glycoside hydrolase family 36 protein [Candidatus Methylacidiphilales bacterium]|nr:glycoside hydrolase family 36 protein [Candidatus Methylacidiphilales bacterium]